jgi:hypothetical protein
MMSSEGMVHLEIDLDRAVMVSVTAGNRREISLDVAARAIYSQLDLPPYSFSIWAFEPADFLVLCDSIEVQDTLVLASSVSTATCSLSLAPWSCQVGVFLRETLLLTKLDICSIPAHAWAERTAIKLLEGCGMVDVVDPATANRNDMSVFWVDIWMHDVVAIPAVQWLAVPEPGYGNRLEVLTGCRQPHSTSPKMLCVGVRSRK